MAKKITVRDNLIPFEREIVRLRENGKTWEEISKIFDVSRRTLCRFVECKNIREQIRSKN